MNEIELTAVLSNDKDVEYKNLLDIEPKTNIEVSVCFV